MERLDKILSNLGYGTRKEIKAIVKQGMVEVDNLVIKDSATKIDPNINRIKIAGETVIYRKYIYIMMNKPDGVVSATFDKHDQTVIDLLEPEHQAFNPFPVGRLDKDTVGLLLITNDGNLNHKLISPKKHIDKVYYAEINKKVTKEDVEAFEKGITLDDGYKCLPGILEILNADEECSKVKVTIHEGKFHQVKRMFESLGKSVVYLKRIEFGGLILDSDLDEGQYRELTHNETKSLKYS